MANVPRVPSVRAAEPRKCLAARLLETRFDERSMIISPVQFKTARQLLKWTQEDLASRSRVSPTAIAILERGVARPLAAKVSAIQTALEDAGVEFTTDEPGVRLRAIR
jgi:DNA-binding XRE family transcriptional regulator